MGNPKKEVKIIAVGHNLAESDEILELVQNIPSGTKLAIELSPETFLEIFKEKNSFLPPEEINRLFGSGVYFYKQIAAEAKKRGIQVIPIDSKGLNQEMERIAIQRSKNPKNKKLIMELYATAFVYRENFMANKILAESPDYVVVGRTHANAIRKKIPNSKVIYKKRYPLSATLFRHILHGMSARRRHKKEVKKRK